MNTSICRNEYPRPQFERADWLNLNGEWEFEFDDAEAGDKEQWHLPEKRFSRRIQVPFCFQSKLSGIGDPGFHDTVWYRRTFTIPDSMKGKRILLHFGAVDYSSRVWVNGRLVCTHEGGHTPFFADITDALTSGDNVLTVKAVDYSRDLTLPRGKQYWKEQSASIWYTRTTGIWQTVWLEAVPDIHLSKVRMTPDIDANEIEIQASVAGWRGHRNIQLKIDISYQGEPDASDTITVNGPQETRRIRLHAFNHHGPGRLWAPEHPNLYDVTFTVLVDGKPVDTVQSYFGMRKISIHNGQICLNNRPYRMRLVLDQGYFPDGILTPPSDEAIRRDVELTKALGFNGARKHQKVEDPRWLYWCDKLGLLVWGEMANAYAYSETYVQRFTSEWLEVMERDYNHPCIVAWVPLNESWGVPEIMNDVRQQHHATAMYYLTRSLDASRPVVSNDGWEHTKSDLLTIHDYESRREVLEERYRTLESTVTAKPAARWLHAGAYQYDGEPVLISEFGGIAFKKSEWEGWGYSGAENEEDFLKRLNDVVKPMYTSPFIQGFCYTQLTDVEQEINGLLTFDRTPKAPLEQIKEIILGRGK